MYSQKNFRLLLPLLWATALGFSTIAYAGSAGEDTSLEDVKKETAELLETLKGYSADQRDKAVKESEAALKNLDRRIDNLEAGVDKNWEEMSQAVRDNARASLKALRKQRTEVAEWYGSMKTSSKDAWADMKTGFSDAYSALSEAWEQAEEEFDFESKEPAS